MSASLPVNVDCAAPPIIPNPPAIVVAAKLTPFNKPFLAFSNPD